MNPQATVVGKIRAALEECASHRLRLHGAWREATGFSPLLTTGGTPLSETEVRTLDQLVFRFGRLQDALGWRLLPALMLSIGEWQRDQPFLDRLNRAEQLGMIPSATEWLKLREIRNQTTHVYPDQPEVVMAGLRLLVAHVPVLESVHEQMLSWYSHRDNP
ncbi:MAG: hypothetical protein HQL59_06900 [Magnetococcales bacterium]|nr:hypothetical protein [Magnetococcales bacterium]